MCACVCLHGKIHLQTLCSSTHSRECVYVFILLVGLVTILRALAHVIWICVILLLRTINYIFMLCHEFITTWIFLCVYTLIHTSSSSFFRRGIIIRAAKSVDNLQRIVIQNGQPLLIKHCPKCRETQSQCGR